jgi:hypothetical protein
MKEWAIVPTTGIPKSQAAFTLLVEKPDNGSRVVITTEAQHDGAKVTNRLPATDLILAALVAMVEGTNSSEGAFR